MNNLVKQILILSPSIEESKSLSLAINKISNTFIYRWIDLENLIIDLNSFDGLIITGHENNVETNGTTVNIPDYIFRITKEALDLNLSILGINIGMHVINIVLGGLYPKTIKQNLKEDEGKREDIFVSPGSKLTSIIGYGGLMRICKSNMFGITVHEKSDLLRASAYSVNGGFVEAFESDEHDLVLGIQFDPFEPNTPPNFKNLLQSILNTQKEHSL